MKKVKEQYQRTVKVYTAAHEIDPDAVANKCLDLVNSDITGIVFSCALAKGFASMDVRNLAFNQLRKGWKEVKYLCGEREYVSICSMGPIEATQTTCNDDPEKTDYSFSFQWTKN